MPPAAAERRGQEGWRRQGARLDAVCLARRRRRAAGVGARGGAGLPHARDHPGGPVRAGRQRQHRGAQRRRQDERDARPAGRHRQSRRRRRHGRDPRGRQGRARRIHAPGGHQRDGRHVAEPVAEPRLRPAQGLRSDRSHRRHPEPDRGASELSRPLARRADQDRQGDRDAHSLRVARRRHFESPHGRAARLPDRHAARARSLQGRGSGAQRSARRPYRRADQRYSERA